MAKDPICGMEVNEKTAKFSIASKGKKYFFCSKNCHDKFSENDNPNIELKNNEKNKDEKDNVSSAKCILPIKGMHCASCAATIEKSLKKLSGVSNANVNFASEKAMVEYDKNAVDESRIIKSIEDAGYDVIRAGKQGLVTLKV